MGRHRGGIAGAWRIDGKTMHVVLRWAGTRLHLQARGYDGSGHETTQGMDLDLDLREEATCTLLTATRPLRFDRTWDLCAPFGAERMPDDYGVHPFTVLVQKVLPDIGADAHEIEQVRRAAHVACRAVLYNTPQGPLGTALTFSHRTRPFVLRALLRDETGRIGQMAKSCPGLLTLPSSASETIRSG